MRNKLQGDPEHQHRIKVNATDVGKKVNVHIPKEQELAKYIKNYKPRDKTINVVELIKKEDFTVDLGQYSLYFGQTSNGKREGLGI